MASLLIHMARRSVLHVHSILLQMIKQNFTSPGMKTTRPANGHTVNAQGVKHVWEV